MRRLPVALVLLVAAGCVTPAPGSSPPAGEVPQTEYDAIEAAIGAPVVEDHDHGDPSLHEGSYDLDLVAAATGYAEGGAPPQTSFVETAVKGGFAYICRSGPDEGLVIFDVSDIEAPVGVGYIHLDAGFEPDIEVSDDGKWAFWETQRLPGSTPADPLDPASAPGSTPYGIHIVDISDKAHPTWAGFTPVPPNGPHSITYARIGDADYVFASVYSWQYVGTSVGTPTLAPPQQQRLVIYKLDTSLPLARLVEVSSYIDEGALGENPVTPTGGLMPHDVSVSIHPITGQTLAYVAYWDLGVVTLDVTDPAHPQKLSAFTDFGPATYRAVHMARIFNGTIDGRVVLVVEPEIGGEADSGYMTFADATDPANVTYLSSWLIPGNITSGGGGLGPHYFDVLDGRVAMASYHAGFWIIDVHDATNLLHPRTVGYALVNATGTSLPGPLGALGGGSSAFDAWWTKVEDQAYMVGGDVHAGLVVYKYTGPAPAQV
ncbi:MAG TPA: hypothetical protein VM370_09235 [Candidatus Thermoplasmatota archaeon]|nr:hypothetical protein [Candidatus Thermoplasmatota archaeon]